MDQIYQNKGMNASELSMHDKNRQTWASLCLILLCLMLGLSGTSQELEKKPNHDPVSKWSFALEAGPAFGGSARGISNGLIASGYGDDRVASAGDGWFGSTTSRSFPHRTGQFSALMHIGYRLNPNVHIEYHFGRMLQTIIEGYDAGTARSADISYQLTGGGIQFRFDSPRTPFSLALGPVLARHRVREHNPYPFDPLEKPDEQSWVAGVKAGIGIMIWTSHAFRLQLGVDHAMLSSVSVGPFFQSDGDVSRVNTFLKRTQLNPSYTRCFLTLGLTPGKRNQ